MAGSENPDWLPQRSANILNDSQDFKPESSISSTTYTERDDGIRRSTTSESVEQHREFEPIAAGDRAALHRLASNLHPNLTRTSTKGGELQRKDTLYNVNIGDPVLDPSSDQFDPYKWSRM